MGKKLATLSQKSSSFFLPEVVKHSKNVMNLHFNSVVRYRVFSNKYNLNQALTNVFTQEVLILKNLT